MSLKRYGIAIVGYGGMGSQHGRLLAGMDRVVVTGICDINREKEQEAAQQGLYVYADYDQLIQDPVTDIVLIATPNQLHKDMAIAAMKSGKHVICEKPVTLNSMELEEILKVSRREDKWFVVHQNRRWDEDYLSMKQVYDGKQIGEVFHVESRVHGSRGIPGDWRQEREFGGGMMLDWGVHLIDRVLLLIEERVKHVYCKCTYVTQSKVDDGFKLFLTFESGKTALLEVGTSNFISLPKWYMSGTHGSAIIEDWEMNGRIVRLLTREGNDAKPIVAGAGLTKTMAPRTDGSVEELPLPGVKTDIRDFYHNVMDAIEGKAEIIVKNDQVLRVMKLMEAAFRSSETNSIIDFE